MDRHRNLQKELDLIIDEAVKAGMRPRLLLHACCAPCSSYVLEYLSRYFDICVYFYNPNIDSREEHDKRARELERLIREMGLDIRLIVGAYEPERFYEIARGHEQDPERGERCRRCFGLRLRETARLLKALRSEGEDFDYFCTTLSISPLKDAKALEEIGESVALEEGLHYLPSDFKKREGYKRSIELSREHGLYRQDYCGCVYSKAARNAESPDFSMHS